MQINKLFAILSHPVKEFGIFCKRDSWKICFQKLGIFCSINVRIKYRIDIIRNLFWCDFFFISFRDVHKNVGVNIWLPFLPLLLMAEQPFPILIGIEIERKIYIS